MMTNDEPNAIANKFNKSYEQAWNSGIDTLLELYTEESILVGYSTAVGKKNISELLCHIQSEGWKTIEIRTTHAVAAGENILTVNEYTAYGSGANQGKQFTARSSHVLFKSKDKWISLLHNAM